MSDEDYQRHQPTMADVLGMSQAKYDSMIAAAPAMLKALEEIRHVSNHDCAFTSVNRCVVCIATKAINRANGL